MENDLLRSVYVKAIFPNMIAILGGTINVFVDGVLIGQRMGEIGIAAVNQSLAVYLILCTVGNGLTQIVLQRLVTCGHRRSLPMNSYICSIEE